MKKLSEGLWSDIVRRGTTGETRLEDNVDNLGKEEFTEYLKKKYSPMDFVFDSGVGCITFNTDDMNIFGAIEFKDDKNRPIDHVSKLWMDMQEKKRDFEFRILNEFKPKNIGRQQLDGTMLVSLIPKEGEMTNSHCIRILDIINKYRER